MLKASDPPRQGCCKPWGIVTGQSWASNPAHQGAWPSGLHHRELVQALGWMEGDVLKRPPALLLPQHVLLPGWLGEWVGEASPGVTGVGWGRVVKE